MEYISYDKVSALGEIGARCSLLFSRLETPQYRPEELIKSYYMVLAS